MLMSIKCELVLGPYVNQVWQAWINSSFLAYTIYTQRKSNFLSFIRKIEACSKCMPEFVMVICKNAKQVIFAITISSNGAFRQFPL